MSNNLASMIIFLETSSTQTTAIICGTSFPCFSLNIYYFVPCKHVCHVVPLSFYTLHLYSALQPLDKQSNDQLPGGTWWPWWADTLY